MVDCTARWAGAVPIGPRTRGILYGTMVHDEQTVSPLLEDPLMATLTIDLPEAPRAQAAYRLAADCPCSVGPPWCCARTARRARYLRAVTPILVVPLRNPMTHISKP